MASNSLASNSLASNSLASTLYRALLSSAKRYGEGAQRRCLPARKELELFNSLMKSRQLPLPASGIMNPQVATTAVKTAFRQPLSDSQETAIMADAFAILRKLRQKETVLNRFPTYTSSECVTDGCKVDAKSRYLWERANGWHFWDYTIRITNTTERTLQLFTEKLRTTDENLVERNLEFALIATIKMLPVIKPGEQFEFTKRMVFRTKCGSLSGSYKLIDLAKGDAIQAKMAPILLTSNVDEEIFNSNQGALNNTSSDGDEEVKLKETKMREGARRRRLRREEEEKVKAEKSGEERTEDTAEKVVEGIIPDSELKTQIRRGLYHSKSLPSFSSIIPPPSPLPFKFQKPSSYNTSSSRKRAIQRATPVTSPTVKEGEENSETEETNSTSTPLLEPEGGSK